MNMYYIILYHYVYSTLISIVLMDYNTLSYAIDDFYLFYDGAVDIQKMGPSDKK